MERQSEQGIVGNRTCGNGESGGNRIYQVTGRELTQIAEISAREAVKMCREERKRLKNVSRVTLTR